MKFLTCRLGAFSLIGALLWASPASAELQIPNAPQGYVLDQAEVLAEATENQLQNDLAALEATNSSQLVVLTVDSLQGYEPEQYALAVLRGWGVGQKEFNNGLVFLIAPNEQKARIEVGYGLEGAITDAQSSLILSKVAIPSFKTGNYDEGVLASMEVLQTLARGESFDLSAYEDTNVEEGASINGIGLFFLFYFLPLIWAFFSFLAGSKSWWLGGIFGAIFGIFIAGLIGAGIGALIGLFVDYILSVYFFKKLLPKKGRGFWWGGGSTGGSGGGRGFGGFGGGSGGGGGATGGW
ncbi:TPM domain-containing protein [Candidatus Peregrinibacteria bacterium]|nr:MAG: TPM domain-containing protein [Candidatus Peregrinibacteria bacterium]